MSDSDSSDGLYDQMDQIHLKVKIAGLVENERWFQIFESAMEERNFNVGLEGSAGDDVIVITRDGGGNVDLDVAGLSQILRDKVVTEGWTFVEPVEQ